jgi:hypothetical protein
MAADEPTEPQPEPRQTLAMRLAERQRQRELRAERLARLRGAAPASPASAAAPEVPAGSGSDDEAEAALEDFLRALTGDRPVPPPPPPPEPGAVLHFQRPERPAPAASSDLDRLPGAGPGLVWALERAGIHCLADLAPLAPADLVARLGPIGRLVPAEVWLETARTPPPT